MIDEKQFVEYVEDIGYCEVDINGPVRTDNGLEIIQEYLEDHFKVGMIPLRAVYEAIPKVLELQDRYMKEKSPKR